MSTVPIRVFIADDHALIRQGIKRIIEFESDIAVVGDAANGKLALDEVMHLKPDVILLDFHMPDMTGLEVLKAMKEEALSSKAIMLTVADDRKTLLECIQFGAEGYILKDSDTVDIVSAIREVFRGESYIDKRLVKLLVETFTDHSDEEEADDKFAELTERELDVLGCISEGMTNREVASTLFLSEKTVKNYASSLFRKLGVKDRVQATLYAINNNLKEYLRKNN
ncbi:response regulator [Fusibacter sp. JL216-2]|uniref:response regulator n=1 Tax=Fusibacter sp. JL216-2 TaxID=3071453 RepID=UPI003D351689